MQKKAEEATKQAHEKYLEKTKNRERKVSPKKETSELMFYKMIKCRRGIREKRLDRSKEHRWKRIN